MRFFVRANATASDPTESSSIERASLRKKRLRGGLLVMSPSTAICLLAISTVRRRSYRGVASTVLPPGSASRDVRLVRGDDRFAAVGVQPQHDINASATANERSDIRRSYLVATINGSGVPR